jgi:crotonobetainyl-CoA:carnitine CoA-transferase CaiB-like acyl-CoA transferase
VSSAPSRLLDGLVVLDFTRVLAGPYCTRLLADLGARVIKIERPGEGDEMRRAHLQLEEGRDDQSSYYTRVNVGKESVALDLANPAAREVVLDLARRADVAIENFVPGVAAKLGCDAASLAAIKPDLVYCSISGYGQTGPWRDRAAFAHIVNAASGMMYLERGDRPPRAANIQAADVLAGTHAFGAILAALLRRMRTGEGARLDVSMLEALVACDDVSYGAVLNGGEEMGAPRPGMWVFEIGGRHIAFQTGGAPMLWPRLVGVIGRPELAADPRFATPTARRDNIDALRAVIAEWIGRFTSADAALEALTAARIPCAPVLAPREVVAHPHLAARGFFPEVPHPRRGTVRVTATPFQVDGQPTRPAGPAPYRIGEHTRAVLEGFLGYAPERVAALRETGAIATP